MDRRAGFGVGADLEKGVDKKDLGAVVGSVD